MTTDQSVTWRPTFSWNAAAAARRTLTSRSNIDTVTNMLLPPTINIRKLNNHNYLRIITFTICYSTLKSDLCLKKEIILPRPCLDVLMPLSSLALIDTVSANKSGNIDYAWTQFFRMPRFIPNFMLPLRPQANCICLVSIRLFSDALPCHFYSTYDILLILTLKKHKYNVTSESHVSQ